MTTVALNNLWNYIQGLSLTSSNQDWLAARLREASQAKREAKKADPTLMTKEAFFAKLDRGEEEYRQGKCAAMLPGESLDDFLRRQGYDL